MLSAVSLHSCIGACRRFCPCLGVHHRFQCHTIYCCRFVKNQLVVEITSSAKLAHLLGWVMRRHSLLAYSLYTAGVQHHGSDSTRRYTHINAALDLLHMPGWSTFACKHMVCCKSADCILVHMALSNACIQSCFKHWYSCAGFVTFVLRLQKRMYMYQFGQYAWTHMILLVVFIPSSFFVSNIFDGLMWFLLPCSLVIINDIGAYLFGKQPAHMFGTAPSCI